MPEPERSYRDEAGRLAAETRFRVRYHETDAMRVVHHAAYITWFEEGRSAFTRAVGYPVSRMEAEGVFVAVTQLSARYHRPARYDDEVTVTTTLMTVQSRGFNFDYAVRSAEGELLVTGSSRQVTVNRQGQVVLMPDVLRKVLAG